MLQGSGLVRGSTPSALERDALPPESIIKECKRTEKNRSRETALCRIITNSAIEKEEAKDTTPGDAGLEEKTLRIGPDPASLLEEAGIGIILLGPDHRIVSGNSPASAFLMKEREDLPGSPIEEIMPAPMRARLSAALTASLARNRTTDLELFLPHQGGCWLSCRCLPMEDGLTLIFRSNTPLRRTEQELKDSEERFRAIRDATFGGIAIHDKGLILECNKGLSDMTGYSREELIGMDGLALTAPEWREYVLQQIMSGYQEAYEIEGLRKDGSRYPLEIRGRDIPFRGQKMRVTEFRDITGLKKTQETLHRLNEELEHKVQARTEALEKTAALLEEQKELLQGIIDNIPVMIAILDSSGRLKLINRAYEKATGWSLEEARSMDILAATHPDPRERERAIQAIQKSEPGWIDFDIHTRSGGVLSTSWANVRFSDGSAMGIGIDISSRRRMEQDLLRLATAVQQSGEGISVANVGGVIEYVNPAFESISGYSRDELVGKPAGSFKDYFAGYNLQDIISRTLNEGKTWGGRQQRRRKTGETIEVDLSVSPVRDESGRITHFVSVVRDVTTETRLQRQLAVSQRMEAIGSLAGGIAHDLKNILTPILINTEIALEDLGRENPIHPVLEEVLDAARLGRDLVQQILTFSRRAPQKKSAVNISSVIRETLSFLRSTLPSTIEIREEVKDACVMAFADATQIKQVLINLGSNAGYAMREGGGTLHVRESKEFLDGQAAAQISPDLKPGPYVQVLVKDTGYGMDEETMEHIFEPFFTTKKGEGTGMGLAVAHGIVKEHQGAITVMSRPGQGSTFTILLPALKAGKKEDTTCKETAAP